MATETDGNCPICQDSWKDVTSTLPCHHRFCLGCILRWAHRNPSCPLCRTAIETVKLSDHTEEYLETASTAPEQLPVAASQAGRAPGCLCENSPHGPVVPCPAAPQGTLSPAEQGSSGLELLGGLLPEAWAGLFRGQPQLLEPVRPWLRQRLEGIFRRCWWLVEAAESSILHDLCVHGLDTEVLAQGLQPVLGEHTAPLVHGVISIIVGQCSEEAQRLLSSGAIKESNGPVASVSSSSSITSSSSTSSGCTISSSSTSSRCTTSSSSSSWMGAPTHGPKVCDVEEEAGTLDTAFPRGPSHLPPVPMQRAWPQEEPRQEMVTVVGPSARGSSFSPSTPVTGWGRLPWGSLQPIKRRVPSPQDSP
ncbi:hypothetical protein HGM15179_017172 [Zosterops borbonicus]|uniref:RING-type domain-containing protein n=1 Tax=Zosterops borbonicus TaxID=364589 RepID=A0A8K1G1J1_9PASS|nr:hypothetical protein HGM15179_017172 [Zosterops borbonicus]